MVAEHPIELRGLGLLGMGQQPTLLERTDQDFISAIQDEMGKGDQFATLSTSVMRAATVSTPLRFFQPMHRTFHLAICEAVCDFFQEPGLAVLGQPRLDPQMIEGSGLVVRRVIPGGGHEAWMQDATKRIRGWVPLSDDEQDPDPAFRRPRLSTGIAALDAHLGIGAITIDQLSESVSGLFVAPPEVCAASKKTLLYGLIPVVSSEYSEVPSQNGAVANEPGEDIPLATLRTIFPVYLSGTERSVPLRLDGNRHLELDFRKVEDPFVSVLRWLLELQAFEDTPEARAVMTALNTLTMQVDPDGLEAEVQAPFVRTIISLGTGLGFNRRLAVSNITVQAGDFIKAMAFRLRDSEDDLTTTGEPASSDATIRWHLTVNQGDAVLLALRSLMKKRLVALSLPQGELRFDRPGTQYQVRAFIRVRRPGCPPGLWWSPYSQPFEIAPWHDTNGKVPPIQVALPDMTNREALKAIKPNVAFVLPPSLYDFIEKNKFKNFLPDGSTSKGEDNLPIDWICSFSIPIITLCAFIVLNIFLSLFNIVFNWMFFIKICLPIPKRK